MCGRFTICSEEEEIATRFSVPIPLQGLTKHFNAAPTQLLPIISNTNKNQIQLFRWGLIPSWAQDTKMGAKMINARSETVAEKPGFRKAFKSKRCLVLADSFYEWQKTPEGKIPMRFTLKSKKPFAFAGLWEKWDLSQDDPIYSFTIITTTPNDLVAPVHNRMPVILSQQDEEIWLDKEQEPEKLQELLKPYAADDMSCYFVSTRVNSTHNNDISLIDPIQRDEQLELF